MELPLDHTTPDIQYSKCYGPYTIPNSAVHPTTGRSSWISSSFNNTITAGDQRNAVQRDTTYEGRIIIRK